MEYIPVTQREIDLLILTKVKEVVGFDDDKLITLLKESNWSDLEKKAWVDGKYIGINMKVYKKAEIKYNTATKKISVEALVDSTSRKKGWKTIIVSDKVEES